MLPDDRSESVSWRSTPQAHHLACDLDEDHEKVREASHILQIK